MRLWAFAGKRGLSDAYSLLALFAELQNPDDCQTGHSLIAASATSATEGSSPKLTQAQPPSWRPTDRSMVGAALLRVGRVTSTRIVSESRDPAQTQSLQSLRGPNGSLHPLGGEVKPPSRGGLAGTGRNPARARRSRVGCKRLLASTSLGLRGDEGLIGLFLLLQLPKDVKCVVFECLNCVASIYFVCRNSCNQPAIADGISLIISLTSIWLSNAPLNITPPMGIKATVAPVSARFL